MELNFLINQNEIVVSYERKKHKIDEIINKVKNAGMEIMIFQLMKVI